MKLPPPNTTPLAPGRVFRRLRRAQRRLADSLVGGGDVFAVVTTKTKVDTGNWLSKRRVCACVLAEELVLFAAGRRPYTERIALADLQASLYNHVTGELMLAPAPGARVCRLKLAPLEGLKVLAQIYEVDEDHA